MKKVFKFINVLSCLLGVFVLAFTSCDVGLGDSVDTAAPTLSITYPPANSVIRDAFYLAGVASDDKGIRSITITVTNVTDSSNPSEVGTYNADYSDGKWKYEFNKVQEDGSYPIKDGKYNFDVYATDTSSRKSGVSSHSFTIDNTAPVFVITSPNSTTSPQSYGSIFKVEGTIVEDQSLVKSMELNIYDSSKKLLKTWTETDVSISGGTSVTFASYGSSDSEYAGIYTDIYNDSTAGTQNFMCSVKLSDGAGVWHTPVYSSDTTPEADSIGNVTTSLWLYDDIYGSGSRDLLSKNADPKYEYSDLLKILNGTYTADASAALEILNQTKLDTNEDTNYLQFSLNKEANPKFSFLGYDFTTVVDDKVSGSIKANEAAKNGSVTFKAEQGLDGTKFTPESIAVYLIGPFGVSGGTMPWSDTSVVKEIFSDIKKYVTDNPSLVECLYDGSTEYSGNSVASWTTSISLPSSILANRYYLLVATGEDKDKVEFLPDSSYFYGFRGVTSGVAPEVKITSPSESSVVNTIDVLNITGEVVSSESAIANVKYEITVTDVLDSNKTLGVISGSGTADGFYENTSVNFTIDATGGTWTPASGVTVDPRKKADGVIYKYSIVVTGSDVTGAEGKGSVSCQLDTKAPVLTIASALPVAKQETKAVASVSKTLLEDSSIIYSVNGNITITGTISETNLDSSTLTVATSTKSVTRDLKDSSFFSEVINTATELDDKSQVTITLTSKDKAGNTNTTKNVSYYVDQSTDYPVSDFMGMLSDTTLANPDSITSDKNLFLTTDKIMASITDDDNIDSILIEFRTDTSSAWQTLFKASNVAKTSYNLSTPLTYNNKYLAEGTYQVRIVITDIKTDGSAAVSTVFPSNGISANTGFWIGIDEGTPKLSFNSACQSGAYTSAGQTKKVYGTVQDSSGKVTIQRFPTKDDALNETNASGDAVSYTENVSSDDGASWEDYVEIPAGATEGTTYYYLVTDKYGRTETYTWRYKIDGVGPTKYPGWTDNLDMGSTWSNAASRTYKIPLSDEWDVSNNKVLGDASGIANVVLNIKETGESYTMKLKEAVDATVSEDKPERYYYYYEYTVPFTSDGQYQLQIVAEDSAGNKTTFPSSTTYYKANIDTTAAEITSLTASKTSLNESDINSFYLTAEISDVHSGITTAKIKAMDGTSEIAAATVAAVDGKDNTYKISIPSSSLTTGEHSFGVKVSDNAGNVSTKTTAVTVDATKPTVEIRSYTPTTKNKSNEDVVNGKIVIKGTATDETKLGSADALSWSLVNSSSTTVKSGTVALNGGTNYAWEFLIDTDEKLGGDSVILDGTYKLSVIAVDAAGNTSTAVTQTIVVEQETDMPIITVGNGISTASATAASSNLITDTGLSLTVTDDDYLYEIKVLCYDSTGTTLKNTFTDTLGSGKSSESYIADVKTLGVGEYKIRIVVTDEKETLTVNGTSYTTASVTKYIPGETTFFSIAVDTDIPDFSIDNNKNGQFTAEKASFTVSGKVSDSTGEVKIYKTTDTSNTSDISKATLVTTIGSCTSEQDWTETITTGSTTTSYNYIAVDKYGRSSYKTFKYKIDKVAPTIASSGWTNNLDMDTLWAKSSTRTYQIPLSDSYDTANSTKLSDVSGIETVTLKVTKSGSSEVTEYSMNPRGSLNDYYTYYNYTVPFETDGQYTVQIVAKDSAGNTSTFPSSTTYYKANIDTTAPEITSVIASKTNLNESDVNSFYLIAVITDETSVFETTNIKAIDGTSEIASATITAVSGQDNTYKIVIPAASLTTGSHEFGVKVTDKAGNVSTKTTVVTIDVTAPVVKISGFTPQATANNQTVANGIIKIMGTVTDETALGTTGALKWELKNSSSEVKASGSTGLTGSISSSWEDIIDTTAIEDGTYTLSVTATDAASNTSSAVTSTIIINQDSDKPKIEITYPSVDTTKTTYDSSLVDTNLFSSAGMNIAVTDDDGIDTVTVACYDSSVTSTENATPIKTFTQSGNNKTFLNFVAKVQDLGVGDYKVRITAVDKKDNISVTDYSTGTTTSTSVPAVTAYVPSAADLFAIAVDGNDLKIGVSDSNNFISENTELTVKGSVSDSTGEVKIYRAKDISNTDDITKATLISTIENCSESKEWTDTITTDTETTAYNYIAVNKYGRTSSIDFKYIIDKVKPSVLASFAEADENETNIAKEKGSAEYLSSSSFEFTVPISDTWVNNQKISDASGIKAVYLMVKGPSDSSYNEYQMKDVGENSVNDAYRDYSITQLFAEGKNLVYIKAVDYAGNTLEYKKDSNYELDIDVTSPIIDVQSPTQTEIGNTKTLTKFSGTATDEHFKQLYVTYKYSYVEVTNKKVEIKTPDPVTYVITNTEGNWEWTLPKDASYTSIQFVAEDNANHKSSSSVYSVIADVTAPTLKLIDSENTWTNVATQTLNMLVGDYGDNGNKYSTGVTVTYSDGTNTGTAAQGASRDKDNGTSGDLIYRLYTVTFDNIEDGQKDITITATDEVGNSPATANVSYYIDTHAPGATITLGAAASEADKTHYKKTATDTASSYEVKLDLDDSNDDGIAVSGIKSVKVTKNGTVVKASSSSDLSSSADEITLVDSSGTAKYNGSIYISADSAEEGTNEFVVTVYDYAGNTTNETLYIYYDKTAPVVEYTSHSDATTVYKTIELKGRVTDESKVTASGYVNSVSDTAIVQYAVSPSSGTPTSWTTATVGTEYTSVTLSGNTWTVTGFDTTKLNNTATAKNYYVRVVFSDNYGNESTGSGVKLNVDQNADRPIISVSTVEKTNEVISLKKVSGTVTYNDTEHKAIKAILYYDGTTAPASLPTISGGTITKNDWKEATITNSASGAWYVQDLTEATHNWYFCVIDANSSIFYTKSGTSASDVLSRPYLQLAKDTSASDNTNALIFKVDATAPKIKMTVSNSALDASSDDWSAGGLVLGGTDNKLYIKLLVSDLNLATTTVSDNTNNPSGYVLPKITIGTQTITPTLRSPITGGGTSEGDPLFMLLSPITLDSSTYTTEGSLSVTAVLSDSSSQEGQGGTNIMLDNSRPTVSIISPTATISDAVSAAVTIKGTVTDKYSSIKKIEWAIPKSGETYSTDSGSWSSVSSVSGASWEIEFSSGASASSNSLLYYAVNDTKYEGVEEVNSGLGIYQIPIYFRVTDSVGNIAVIDNQYVYADPDGGKPKAWINSPESGSVTSGTVSLYGGASDNVSVSTVCVQIDVNGDGEITEYDYALIKQNPADYGFTEDMVVASTTTSGNDWYIKAEGTNSWKLTIDTSALVAYSGDEITITKSDGTTTTTTSGKTYLFARVRAIDGDNQTREPTECNIIQIDSTVPWFTDVALVQFGTSVTTPVATTSKVTEREYISGMYVSNVSVGQNGTWYLTAKVNSNSDITSITSTTLSSVTASVIELSKNGTTTFYNSSTLTEIKEGVSLSDAGTAKYQMFIPLKTDESGMIYAELKSSNNTGEGSQTIKINIDSDSPSLYTIDGAETEDATEKANLRLVSQNKNLGTDLTSNALIENSDGYFTFADRVYESGSGLQFVAFYFLNNVKNTVYDPMQSKFGTAVSNTKSNGSLYINDDKLAALYISSANRDSEYTFTSSQVNSNFVRVGGLVKIGGVYHTITAVSGTTVTFSPSVSKTFTEVEVIYAQVVDHMITESLGGYDANDDYNANLLINDDGDGMCESISQIGSVYQWSATVNSNNLPDGKTYICVTAMDNAGNISHGKILSMVANNRPRITKVFIGTDLNGNEKYDFDANTDDYPIVSTSSTTRTADGKEFGEFNYYTAYNKQNGFGQSVVTLTSNEFKVISGLCVIPEFTGGNESLKYIEENATSLTASTSGTLKTMKTRTELASLIKNTGSLELFGESGKENTSPVAYSGTDNDGNTYYDFGGIIVDNDLIKGADGATVNIKLTFWDATDSSTGPSTSGQWATLVIPVTNKSSDREAPKPKIAPFYWNSSSDNSVATDSNGTLLGHIELEGDLTTEIISALGSDPKVSGKIKIQGTVEDDVRLSSISATVFGTSYDVGTYSNGEWSAGTGISNTGVVTAFSAEDVYVSQKGHKVKYSITVDTEKLSGVVGKDQVITVNAKDWKNNMSTAGTTQTTANNNTDYYKMDVVPYVTEIVTSLSSFNGSWHSTFARTALGHYPVAEGTQVQLVGYNLGTNIAKVTVEGMSETTLGNGTVGGNSVSNAFTLTTTSSGNSGAKSGAITVTVSGIPVMNNLNNNDAVGKFAASGQTGYTLYKNYYNRQPNNSNNYTLNDDLYLDVWQFKNAVEPVSGSAEYVTMKINPKTGLPGFSFANSILYYNMPGYGSNQSINNWDVQTGLGSTDPYSQLPVGMNYGGFSHNSFTFDSYGYAYGAAMCTDTSSADSSAFFQFFSREAPLPTGSMNQNMNYANTYNASRLDSSSVPLNGDDSGWTTDINRIQSISMETSYSGGSGTVPSSNNPVYVFMAYYDQPLKQVRFRWGIVGSDSYNLDGRSGTRSDYTSFSRIGNSYGLDDIVDSKYTGVPQAREYDTSCRPSKVYDSYIKYSYNNNSGLPIQVVAASGVSGARGAYSASKNGGAGKYVSLSIVNKDTSNPIPIVTWYDSTNMKLVMAYNTSPTTSTSWTSRVIDSAGGLNVKTAVDGDGGIHFAYYDSINGSNLKYAYLDSYNSSNNPVIVDVDNYGAVGAKCTIDVVKEDSNWVPYITYQNNGYLGTPIATKIAHRADFTSNTYEGSDSSDFMTGKWEISVIPTTSIPKDDLVSVGFWKDSDGSAKQFTSNVYWKSGDSGVGLTTSNSVLTVASPSIVKGNNTANPIVGYGIDTGAIEMAQKK